MLELWDKAKLWFNTNIGGLLGNATNKTADWLEKATGGNINAATAKKAIPFVAAGAVAATGIAMYPVLEKIGKGITGFARNIVTGFGYFEKIPLIGKLFTGAGWLVDQIGHVAGWAIAGVLSFIAFNMFKSAPGTVGNSVNTPNSGTGAVPQEPVVKKVAVHEPGTDQKITTQNVPVAPTQVTPLPGSQSLIATQPHLSDVEYERLRGMRATAIQEQQNQLSDQLRDLMHDENQRYENRRLFLRRASEFAGKDETSPRNRLIGALKKAGLKQEEASHLVAPPPDLRVTVTPGATPTTDSMANGKPTDFGGDYSKLIDLANRMEDFYGVGFFTVTHRVQTKQTNGSIRETTAQQHKKFSEMSVTQQQEFLEKALQHCRTNYAFFLKNCIRNRSAVTSMTRAGTGSVSHWVEEDFKKESRGLSNLFATIPEGSETYRDKNGGPQVRMWREEYHFLSGLNTDSSRSMNWSTPDGFSFRSSGSHHVPGAGLSTSTGAFSQWQALLDAHREELRKAETGYNGEIKHYMLKMHFMQHSLEAIRKHSVALLDYGRYEGRVASSSPDHHLRSYIGLRDLRRAAPGKEEESDRMRMEGTWVTEGSSTDWRFTVRAISTGDKGENRITLAQPLVVNTENGEGMDKLLIELDRARQLKQATQSAVTTKGIISSPVSVVTDTIPAPLLFAAAHNGSNAGIPAQA